MEALLITLFAIFMFAIMFATVGVTIITAQMFYGRIKPTLKMVLIPITFYPALTLVVHFIFDAEFVYVFWGYGGLFGSVFFVTYLLNQHNN
ncbi:MAG: hypothetical protein IBX55_00805 [Methyloprofundus sp.]|nr:hypothetical protein [Methyloprofundus sp.]